MLLQPGHRFTLETSNYAFSDYLPLSVTRPFIAQVVLILWVLREPATKKGPRADKVRGLFDYLRGCDGQRVQNH